MSKKGKRFQYHNFVNLCSKADIFLETSKGKSRLLGFCFFVLPLAITGHGNMKTYLREIMGPLSLKRMGIF